MGIIVLALNKVHAGYGKKEILHGVSLQVTAGEFISIIGVNGAGKSTLLKVVAGLIRQSEGDVILGGQDISRKPIHARVRDGLSYFMQGGQVFPSLTVKENLGLAAQSRKVAEREQVFADSLHHFPALCEKYNQRAGLLSGGQRQALAFCMVLALGPKVLLLDEPTAGLSPALAKSILERVYQSTKGTEDYCIDR